MNTSDCIKLISERLKTKKPVSIPKLNSYKEAAVLIPIFEKDKKVHILFTKRSKNVEHHKGQISFPGGRIDDTDPSPEHAALREAHEEIGLKRENVKLLGRLDDTITYASGYIVHPFVGLIPYPYDFKINDIEVERILFVPLDFFLQDGTGTFKCIYHEGKIYNSLAYEYNGDIIWGATARIVKNLIEVISGRSSVW